MNTIQNLAQKGRGSDTSMAHVTPGDVVVPRDVWMENPTILGMVKKSFDKHGMDYGSHMVGSGRENINPETGLPEFRFGGGWLKPLATIAGFALGGPVGGALAAGGTSLLQGEGVKGALLSGGGAYLGGQFLGTGTGDIAGNLTTNSITRGLGESLAGSALGGIGVNGLTGSLTGQAIGSMANNAMKPVPTGEVGGYRSATPTTPQENLDISRPEDMALPGSLSGLGGLSDVQRTSNIATQGVEGQGASPEAQAYFLNQIRRRLTDDNSTASEINPAEENYLKRSGVSYQPGDVKSILEGIARKDNAAKTLTA